MKIITEEMDIHDLRIACNGYYNGNVCEATVEQLVRFYESLTFRKHDKNDNVVDEWKVKVILKK